MMSTAAMTTAGAVANTRSFVTFHMLTIAGLEPLPPGYRHVFAGSLGDRFVVSDATLQKFQAFNGLFANAATSISGSILIEDDVASVKLALRLARERSVDPVFRTSRTALGKCLRLVRRYGLQELETVLADRYAVLQNTVMPEIAAMLETNPRRKLYLLKSVVRKARFADLLSGGTQGVQSKLARVKIATSLVETCEAGGVGALSDLWCRKYLRVAEKLLNEGRPADTLPQALATQITSLQTRINELRKTQSSDGGDYPPSKLTRSLSESRRAHLERKANLSPVEAFAYHTDDTSMTVLNEELIEIIADGDKVFQVHRDEIARFRAFASMLDVRRIRLLDEPSRFEIALHLVRCGARLEDAEKMDEAIIKSYRRIAWAYGVDWSITRRLEAWLAAHRNGVGGARNPSEEIRALQLTRMLSPEKGEALVASALAEAYLERVQKEESLSEMKKLRLLEKAETNLRVVLPVLLTSLSVVQVSKEQRSAIDQSVAVLKQVLAMQGRAQEADALDKAIALFSKGVQGAAKELSAAVRSAPPGMYA